MEHKDYILSTFADTSGPHLILLWKLEYQHLPKLICHKSYMFGICRSLINDPQLGDTNLGIGQDI